MSVTAPLYPFAGVTARDTVPEAPGATEMELGVATKVTGFGGVTTVSVCDALAEAP